MVANYKRKADNREIVALNSVGLSLSGIAERLGVHHTTVTYRLREVGIPPADTRRAFMEDIFKSLSLGQQAWLIDQLGGAVSIKDYIRSLIVKEFINRTASVMATAQ